MKSSLAGMLALAVACVWAGRAAADMPLLVPAAGAREVCPDTPLKLAFAATPEVGRTGIIEVRDAADDRVVASVDLSKPTATQTIGGLANYVYYTWTLAGNTLTLHLPNHALGYGKTYYVKVPAGAIAGDPLAQQAWRFTTRAAPPQGNATTLTVAEDSSADFATIQGAIDFVPAENRETRRIVIRPGTYEEILCILRKDNVMLLGVDRARTIIAYANNDRFNPNSGGNPFAAGAPQPGAADPARDAVYRRGVVLAHQAHGLVIANLTIRNTTPKGGSQAETIILNGTPDARALLAGLDLYSFQDTVQFNGQTYLGGSYIEGDVDFTWGTGPSFFEKVHACAVSSGAIFNTARCPATPPGNHGFVFKDCVLDGKPNVTGTFLARIEANRFPTSETILMNCTLSPAIAPAGWRAPTGGDASQVHFWEYNSHDAQGKPVDVSQRIAGSKQLAEPADHEAIVNYSSARYVLGGAWDPVLAPVIVALGSGKAGDEPMRLHVKAVGVPSPTVQWSRDGSALPGETGEDLVVKTPGKYAVVVTNSAGKVAAEVGAVSP